MAFVTTYKPLPIHFTHGEGVWLFDDQGKAYLDGLSGIAVSGLGHAHPQVTKTIQEQAARVIHTSNLYQIPEQTQLAEKLTKISGTRQAFFANSGAEANEAAIKLTRLYGHKKGISTPSIVVMDKAFHGRTMATLTASGSRKVQGGFEPFVPGFIRAPFNDIDALQTIADNREDIVAVMLEPIQGEGGMHVADLSYLRAVANLCKENDWLLIFDEVQTGNARTGKFFAFMHAEIQPDIITTAKGLGNGIPIGVCLIGEKAADLFYPGNHGSTFGGNPLACAIALTVLRVIEEEKLEEKVARQSLFLRSLLEEALDHNPHVRALRGKGYMLGIELDRPAYNAMLIGLENGVLFNITADSVIRLLPPLIMEPEDITMLVDRVVKTIDQFVTAT